MPDSAGSSTSPGAGTEGSVSSPPKVRAVEEVEMHLSRADFGGAVRAALPLIMVDVQRAYDLSFPPHWTARDVLAHGLRSDMGGLPDLLFQLYSLYEPVRYGLEKDWVRGDVRDIVRRIYTETSLRSVADTPAAPVAGPSRPTFSVVPAGTKTAKPAQEGRGW